MFTQRLFNPFSAGIDFRHRRQILISKLFINNWTHYISLGIQIKRKKLTKQFKFENYPWFIQIYFSAVAIKLSCLRRLPNIEPSLGRCLLFFRDKLSVLLCKAIRQYLPTCKASRYCLLTSHGITGGHSYFPLKHSSPPCEISFSSKRGMLN